MRILRFIEKNKNKITAVGEVGLDYFWIKDKQKEQKELFEKMISLAEKINKPIIVHSRKAEEGRVKRRWKIQIKGRNAKN